MLNLVQLVVLIAYYCQIQGPRNELSFHHIFSLHIRLTVDLWWRGGGGWGCSEGVEMCPLIKFADDTTTEGLIHGNNDWAYLRQLQSFVEHYDANFIELNISKTNETIIDFGQKCTPPPPVITKGMR